MSARELFFIGVIDRRIDQTRRHLNYLYSHKSILKGHYQAIEVEAPDMVVHESVEIVSINKWAREQHRLMQIRWQRYGIAVPKYDSLENRLKESYDVIRRLSSFRPELKNRLGLLLVPPAKALKLPVKNEFRQLQKFINYGDYIEDGVTFDVTKEWRLLVVHTAINGLSLGSPRQIISRRLHEMAGFDTRALGPTEYAALSLQHPAIIDRSRPVALLRKYAHGKIALGLFSRGRYCFVANSKFAPGEYRFRPAVEIAEQ